MDTTQRFPNIHTDSLEAIMYKVQAEVLRASNKFLPMRSMHEGHSIIREEYKEFEEEVFKNNVELAFKEAIQLAAMAVRFIHDIRNQPNPLNKVE